MLLKEKSDEFVIFIYENDDNLLMIEYCKETLRIITLEKHDIKFKR